MRVLAVADLHYSLPQYDWLLEVAARFDVVIIAGDQLDIGSLVDPRAQAIVVQKYIRRLRDKTRVVVCSGNHDLDSRSASGEKVTRWILDLRNLDVPSDGDSLALGDTVFTICPWWDGPVAREAIARQLATAAETRGTRWIWVHHAPPQATPISWDGKRHQGDVELEHWIAEHRPDIVFSGHVHQSPFTAGGSWVDRIGSAWVFNAGQQFGAPPTCIVMDTDRQVALWCSAAGNEIVRLDLPLERLVAKLAELPDWLTDQPRSPDPDEQPS